MQRLALTLWLAAAASATSLVECLNDASVPFSTPESPLFKNQSSIYNINAQFTPVVVTIPTTPDHVSASLQCASACGVKVQAKGGGHSFAGYGSGGRDGSLIVDLESFQDIIVGDDGIATIGGGVRLGNLALSIYKQGKRAMPHGSCSGVGMGGHATHGGYGYASRTWGLAMDTILAMDVVLPNGTFVHTAADAYPELFFALRGAADSLGVVTTFYSQTYPAPETVVNYSFDFSSLLNQTDSKGLVTALLHMQDFSRNASVIDRNHGFGTYIDGGSWSTSGTFIGSLQDFNATVKPEFLRGFPEPDNERVEVVSWLDNLQILAGEPLETPIPGSLYSEHDDFFAKSVVVPELETGDGSVGVSEAAATAYFDYILKYGKFNATSGWYTIFDLYGGADSQVNVHSPSEAAYPHRNTLWVFQHYGYANDQQGPFPTDIHPFIEGLNAAIPDAQPQTTFDAYINYQDSSLTPEEAHKLYYGDELYAKLAELKKVLDPDFVLWHPTAIGT